MRIPPRQAEDFCRNPPQGIRAILLYGPDSGLVSERADNAARAAADDVADPFSTVTLDAAALAEDPVRLADEAASMALGTGRRVVRLRGAKDPAARAVETAFALPWDSLVLVEAGDLGPRSRLRTLFERADDAAAVACYLDDARERAALVRQSLREAGIRAEPEVVMWISDNLGSDRKVTRMELEKLALYVGGAGSLSLEDAQAVVGDSAMVTVGDIADAAFGGEYDALVRALARARFEKVPAVQVVRGALAHLVRLEEAAVAVASGEAAEAAVERLNVFFKRRAAFRAQLARWPARRLARARAELLDIEIGCKSTGLPADEVCERGLMRIAALSQAS